MKNVAPVVRRPISVCPEDEYPELGIRSFGKGTFHKPSLSGMSVGSKKLFSIEPGDLFQQCLCLGRGCCRCQTGGC